MIWWKFMLILEIYILIIIFYCILMKFMQRQKISGTYFCHSCTVRTMFLVCPVSPSATGTCEQRLRFHQNRSAAEPWLLWTGAEISSSSSKKKFDMTFLEVLELQLFSVCNKHIDLVLWKNGPLGKILTFSTEYVCWAGKQRLKNVRETSQTPWWMAADSL